MVVNYCNTFNIVIDSQEKKTKIIGQRKFFGEKYYILFIYFRKQQEAL